MSQSFRIAYDARLAIGHYRGMGRFLRQLIAGRERSFIGLCASSEHDGDLLPVASGLRAYPLWEQLSVPRQVRRFQADALLAPYNTAPLLLPSRVLLVLVVHDLIFMEPSDRSLSLYQNLGRRYRRAVVPPAIRRADIIVTVSHHTAGQLAARHAVERERIRVIPNNLDPLWFASPPGSPSKPAYVLVVGGEAPSKNLERAIEAFAQCRAQLDMPDLRLKVAGVKPRFHAHFRQRANAAGVEAAVEFLPYLTDDRMRELYAGALAFLLPSLAEGFGIPVLEAMASGVPVAAATGSSLQEIGGEAAIYFDPRSVRNMADALARILVDRQLAAQLVERGRCRARQFHPNQVQEKIDALWSEVDARLMKREGCVDSQ